MKRNGQIDIDLDGQRRKGKHIFKSVVITETILSNQEIFDLQV